MQNSITAAINRIFNKIANLIRRTIITNVPPVDNDDHLIVQTNSLGQAGNMEVIYPYGMFGNPPQGSMALRFNSQGAAGNRAGIPFDPSSKIKGSLETECGIGNPATQTYFKFTFDGRIEVWSAGILIKRDLAQFITLHNHTTVTSPVTGNTGVPNPAVPPP